jgi:predicted NAD/FAD-dependent oxidoreductase
MERPRIAIIGAGISGLACGQALLRAGASVVVFEKSRSLGGRLRHPDLRGKWMASGW